MGEQPKVSVIIPVYNAEKYLRECLDSVVNQTLRDIEIICVDDGSTDSSLEILRDYEARDGRVRVLTQENINAGAARNHGLRYATGEFLMFLDADDLFRPDMMEACVDKLERDASDIVVFSAEQWDMRTGERIHMPWSLRMDRCPAKRPFAPNDMAQYIFNSFQNWPWNKMFRSSFIRINNIQYQEVARTNDMAFVCLALVLAERISVIERDLVTYRIGTGTSLQSTNNKAPTAFWEASKETKRRLEQCGLYHRYEKSLLNAILGGSLYNLNSVRNDPVAFRDIWSLIRYHGEEDFGFTAHGEEYYYDRKWYSEYMRIRSGCKGKMEAVKTPKVTIIIPSLNSIAYMEECIQSAVSQTLREVEIICVDAGSTDGTVELLERYAAADPRIRIVHSEKRSYGHQVNLGLDLAQGEYFAILESDDYVLTEMYETLYELALSNRCDGVKSDWCIFVGEGEERTFTRRHLVKDKALYRKVLYPRKDTELFRAHNINTPGIYSMELIRRRGIRLNESPGASFQDNGLWFQIFMWAESLYFHPKAFYMIRRDNPGSSVHSREKVYCGCDEYDYIRRIVLSTPEAEKYAPICAYFRFCHYNFTLNRIGQEFRLEFLQRYAQDFQKLRQEGELAPDWFTKKQWETLQKIMNTPEEFYYNSYAGKGLQEVGRSMPTDVEWLQREVRLLRTQVNVLKKEIENIHASTTYKIGRLITWIPRMLRGGLRCLREHGFSYTMERVLIHLRLKKGKNKSLPAGNVSQPLPAKPPAVKKDYDFYSKLPPERYPEELKLWYREATGRELNLDDPSTFNEKIQWMKLYDSTPIKTRLADKYLVRDWVKEKIGEEYLIPLLGVWDSFDEIDFDKLPDRFALKANHGSGWNIIVKDKASFDKVDAKKKFDSWMGKNFAFSYGLELHYMNIPPKIIAEQYIQNAEGLIDYRFYCFDGKPEQVWVDIYSGTPQHLRSVYDMDWNLLPLKCTWPEGGELLSKKPKNFEKMKEFAAVLSKEFAFVRVDFFEVDEKLYMGEMTFTPMSGTGKFEPTDWNFKLGEILTLPPKSPIPERKI